MNSSDIYQVHSSVSLMLHQSEFLATSALSEVSCDFQPSLISQKIGPTSGVHCKCVGHSEVKSWIVACFSPVSNSRFS